VTPTPSVSFCAGSLVDIYSLSRAGTFPLSEGISVQLLYQAHVASFPTLLQAGFEGKSDADFVMYFAARADATAAHDSIRSEMLMEHYCDVLNGLVKVVPPSHRALRPLDLFCLFLLVFSELGIFSLIVSPCIPSTRLLSTPKTKLLQRHARLPLPSSAALSLLSQAKFFETDAPYFIGQLSKALSSPQSNVSSCLAISHARRPSIPSDHQRKRRSFHFRDNCW
jgi:hypothetical protein